MQNGISPVRLPNFFDDPGGYPQLMMDRLRSLHEEAEQHPEKIVNRLLYLADARENHRQSDCDDAEFNLLVCVAFYHKIEVPWSEVVITRKVTAPLAAPRISA